jgi:cysteinyl-tRNA synthetase
VSLRVYNSLTRQKEEFVPLAPSDVKMYACGVTPYDAAHVGHARSALVFDVIVRYLRHRGYRVRFARNFTDIDDKIIARAARLGISHGELADRHIQGFRDDMDRLGLERLPEELEPRATAYIPQMVALIQELVARGYAYVVDGDVYFEVRRFPAYGRLSGRNLDDLLAGARVDVDERKRDPRDFALWKSAKPGEPQWDSPWGPGRPGWHIECSVMVRELLGQPIDIHGGGEDLIFPHHECEIAQSEAATGVPFARYWMHNGLVNLAAEKMSKSLGNVLTIRSLLERHEADALRLYLLQTHYRNPVEFSEERIVEAARALGRFRDLFDAAARLAPTEGPGLEAVPDLRAEVDRARARFEAAMDDDFHTPQAIAALQDFRGALNGCRERVERGEIPSRAFHAAVEALWGLTRVLGFRPRGHETALAGPERDAAAAAIERLVQEREEARRRRDWARADTIRAELEAQGVTLEDTPGGTRWKRRISPTGP